jgi:hypothetical protein
MNVETLWNAILTGLVGVLGFFMKHKFDDLNRISALLNKTREEVAKTREEVARDYVTRAEVNSLVDKLGDRFDRAFERLEHKVEEMNKRS